MIKKATRITLCVMLLALLWIFPFAGTAYATTSSAASSTSTTSVTSVTTTTTAATAGTAPNVNITTAPSDATLGSISFKTSNSKRLPLEKSTVLYITIKDMVGSINTVFTCSNLAIASIEKLSNTSVKVVGLKPGEVVITATAGGKSAKYTLIVGDETPEEIGNIGLPTAPPDMQASAAPTGTVNVDLFADSGDKLAAYSAAQKESNAGDLIIGAIGLAAIIGGIMAVVSIMLSGGSPKVMSSPISYKSFGLGGFRGKKRKRLLPDHYYRQIHKY